VYVGVYSPSKTTYQLEFPGSALLAAPISGEFAGNATRPSSTSSSRIRRS